MQALKTAFAALALAAAGSALAQPGEAIKIIVPFAAGGPTDQIARVIAVPLGNILGKAVVVDNRGGAGGVVGVGVAAKSPPDGSTLLLTTSSLVITAGTVPTLPYNAHKDVEPVYLLGEVQTLLVVRPTLGVNTLQELAAKAKGPGKLNYGSTGVGGTMHIGAELFAKAAGVSMVHVPYRGAAPTLVDLIAGNIDLLNADVPVLRPYVKDGRVKALAIYDIRRSPLLPDVPTAAEAGLPSLQMNNWYGVLVPAGMAPELKKKFEQALDQVVHQPEIAAKLAEAGFIGPQGTQAFKTKLDADFKHWIPWLKEAGIQSK